MRDVVREIWKDEFDAAERRGLDKGLEKGREEGLEKGREEGLEKGREEGLEKGREEAEENIIAKLLKRNISVSNISEWLGFSVETITAVAHKLGITPVIN